MIDPTNIQKKRTWIKRGALSLVAVLCIGVITIAALKFADTPRTANTSTQSSSEPTTQQRGIDALKASAFDKLAHGDQAGGVKDFEQALALAKAAKNSAQITYFEQQIDFAKNSGLSNRSESGATPAPAPSNASKDKNYTTF